MIRKFNYTNRIKIKRADLLISIDRSDSIPRLDADIRIEAYRDKLPADGKIYIEAYHRTKFDRFFFGTVGNLVVPEERSLHSFSVADLEDIRFRIKVVDESAAHGRILALAEGVGPVSEDERNANRLSLLGVDCSEDMGNRIWALDLDSPDMPWLKMNSHLPDPHRLLRSDEMFFCMVYPEIVRQILTHVLLRADEDYSVMDADSEDDDWRLRWLYFGRKLSGEKWPVRDRGDEICGEWIEDCVDSFCRSQRVMQRVLGILEVAE